MSSITPSTRAVQSLLSQESSTHRRWLILIDGTWCKHNPRKGTIVGKLKELVETDSFQVPKYYPGIGTSYSWSDQIIGGATGWGIKRRLFEIFYELVENYKEGDELVIVGYSRGAFMAHVLAGLLDCVGLPQGHSKKTIKKSFQLFWENQLENLELREMLKVENNALYVPIKFLGLFDTVGTLGVPSTGLLTPMKWAPKLIEHLQFRSTAVPRNVITFRHALALDEHRETFSPTLMHINDDDDRDFKQVWFSGSHCDLGKMKPNGVGLVNVALRWMIEELDAVCVRFCETALKEHFPHFTRNPAILSRLNSLEWLESGVRKTLTPFWRGGGKKKRVPGWYGLPGMKTNEFIHPSLVMRDWARSQSNRSSIEGHSRHRSLHGTFYYEKTGRWSLDGSWSPGATLPTMGLDMQNIPEDRFGALQAFLGGYPMAWWDLGFGSWGVCDSE